MNKKALDWYIDLAKRDVSKHMGNYSRKSMKQQMKITITLFRCEEPLTDLL